MSRPKPPCERCGSPALVHITNEAPSGATVRHLCLRCADVEETAFDGQEQYLNYGAILISVGMIALLLSVFADELNFGSSQGFGAKQELALAMAMICVFTAALIRVPTLMVIGVLGGGLTVLADVLHFGHDPGFGWHQQLGTLIGALLVVCGWLESRRQN